jgi:hypothetical protein
MGYERVVETTGVRCLKCSRALPRRDWWNVGGSVTCRICKARHFFVGDKGRIKTITLA